MLTWFWIVISSPSYTKESQPITTERLNDSTMHDDDSFDTYWNFLHFSGKFETNGVERLSHGVKNSLLSRSHSGISHLNLIRVNNKRGKYLFYCEFLVEFLIEKASKIFIQNTEKNSNKGKSSVKCTYYHESDDKLLYLTEILKFHNIYEQLIV